MPNGVVSDPLFRSRRRSIRSAYSDDEPPASLRPVGRSTPSNAVGTAYVSRYDM